MNNKVLLHSTGNYIQYPVINHNGKEYFKKSYPGRGDRPAAREHLPEGWSPYKTHLRPKGFLKKLKIELPCDPAIPLLAIYPEKTVIQKDTCTRMFIAAL